MKELELLGWNIHCQSDPQAILASFVEREMPTNNDVFVFTEVTMNDGIMKLMERLTEYIFFYTTTGNNEVLIGVKNKYKSIQISDSKLPKEFPNFLHIEVEGVHIIGTRVRIESTRCNKMGYCNKCGGKGVEIGRNTFVCKSCADQDYIDRKKQIECIIRYVDEKDLKAKPLFILGDFNSSYIRGSKAKSYPEVKDYYEENQLSSRFYNYQIMRDLFKGHQLTTYTPDGYSWGLDYRKGQFGYIEQDHLIVSDKIRVDTIEYDWSFVEKNKDSYISKKIPKGTPEHAKVLASISIK